MYWMNTSFPEMSKITIPFVREAVVLAVTIELKNEAGKEIGMFDIQEELKKLPGKPGVYLMHDETDKIIYVGKAISLKNRVRQYFQSSQ